MPTVVKGLSYPVIICEDAAARIEAVLPPDASRIIILADAKLQTPAMRMARKLRKRSETKARSIAIPGGERAKSMAQARALCERMLELGADRKSLIVAMGGGTITDLAGFAAAIFMRGIRWIAIPTTLVGMADAAIGGKTGVNVDGAKNVAGAFWDPLAVIAGTNALQTLPLAHRRAGMAEIVKAAIIGDAQLLAAVETSETSLKEVGWGRLIAAAARVKAAIVAADPRERNARAALNLGHTVAHALESASGYRIGHGQAVSVGLRAAGLMALANGLWSPGEHARMLRALRRIGLPLSAEGTSLQALLASLRHDKKAIRGELRFVLPVRVGEVRWNQRVSARFVRAALERCLRQPSERECG